VEMGKPPSGEQASVSCEVIDLVRKMSFAQWREDSDERRFGLAGFILAPVCGGSPRPSAVADRS
jgi:hypothetical protein